MQNQVKNERLYYLDWLRVFAVMLLIPFHTGMIFVRWNFHIKNKDTSTGLDAINAFIDNWHMPLFFLLAGASTWLALKKRTPAAYLKERFLRLLVPLVFGMLIIVPPQTFFERVQKSGFKGNYLDFYAHLFNGFYPQGNLTWNHLWFLFYLFLISAAVLPIILIWQSGKGAAFIKQACTWLAKGHRIFLLGIPLVVIQVTLKVAFPGPQNVVTDWARILFMSFVFLYGAMFYIVPDFRDSIERNLGVALVTGAVISTILIAMLLWDVKIAFGYNLPNLLLLGVMALVTLCWLIVILGLAQRTLNFSNGFLEYANESVLPIYILHQTIIITLGFYIVETDFSVITKYTIINLVSLVLIVVIYDTMVKRFRALRFLFGMRSLPRKI